MGNPTSGEERRRRERNASGKYCRVRWLEWFGSSWKMHLLFTRRVLPARGFWGKVRNVNGREYRSLSSKDEYESRGAFMSGPNQVQSRMSPASPRAGGTVKRSLRNAKTSDIRAFLSELRMLPHSHRKLLCKLLKRAAATAPRKASVVHLAEPHQTMKP